MAEEENKPQAGAFLKLSDEDIERHRRLLAIEPDLSKLVEGKRAWSTVIETLKKAAILVTTISGGLLVLREILRGLQQ